MAVRRPAEASAQDGEAVSASPRWAPQLES